MLSLKISDPTQACVFLTHSYLYFMRWFLLNRKKKIGDDVSVMNVKRYIILLFFLRIYFSFFFFFLFFPNFFFSFKVHPRVYAYFKSDVSHISSVGVSFIIIYRRKFSSLSFEMSLAAL